MLKIKDSVDLKELEKFGFLRCVNNVIHQWYYARPLEISDLQDFKDILENNKNRSYDILEQFDNVLVICDLNNGDNSRFNKEDNSLFKKIYVIPREINYEDDCFTENYNEENIQDLIKADLIEKVEE